MKTFIFALFLCLAISTCAQNASTGLPEGKSKSLKARSESLLSAEKMKDVAALERLLANDFYQVGNDGKLNNRNDFMEDAAEGNLRNYRLYGAQVLAVGENAAILTYDAIIQEPEGDDGLAPRYQHFSDLWVKNGDEWQLRFEQITPRRPID